jgi:four helix bundle protein
VIDREAALVRKFIELAKLLNVYLNQRHERYALSNRIRNSAYEVYGLVVEGQKRYHKKTTLTNLDIAHEQLRMQLYLAYELGYFRFVDGRTAEDAAEVEAKRWQVMSRLVDELGRMIGGWIRHELAESKDSKESQEEGRKK